MGYMHIDNLYKSQDILLFKECYALEKIHGTSAHISYNNGKLSFFSGGSKNESFVSLFNQEKLLQLFINNFGSSNDVKVVVFGEAYGGKMQGMKATYGPNLKFVVFDVRIENCWLSVSQAEDVANKLELEFVHYVRIPTDLIDIDKEKDANSVQAIRNGMGSDHLREGVVLRPLIEVVKNNNERIICKHKREEFKERQNVPKVVDAEQLNVLQKAEDIAAEWVVPMRLEHVLQRLNIQEHDMKYAGDIIKAMIEDVYREAKGEIVESKEVSKAISKKTIQLWKNKIKEGLKEI